VRHDLHGRYRVVVTVQGGSGVALSTRRGAYPMPLLHDAVSRSSPYYNSLLDEPEALDLDAGVWDLRGGALEVHPHPTMYSQSLVRAIRFEPVEEKQPAASTGAASVPRTEIYGVSDTPDIAQSDGTPDDRPYRANVIEHARLGFKRLYWRADGQCCDFHTQVGTVRYPVRRTHSVFTPHTLPYGMALQRHDLLSAAVEEAHRHGMELFGYMRLNAFRGNVTPRFFIEHPELHDVMEIGTSSPRMCYFLSAFRQWKVEIAREVVRRGVDGLLLDLTRSPPMIDYHPKVVDAFTYTNGFRPPRNLDRGYVSYGIHPLEKGEEWLRWWKFRAQGFTSFGRELRAMLREEGKPDLPLHVQVRPQMALFDGLDLEAWIEEGLMDVLNVWPTPDFHVPEEIFETVKDQIPLRCTVSFLHDPEAYLPRMEQVLGDRCYAGLTIYESNMAVWSPFLRAAMERWVQEC
jgi:hypothetical protein